jgi:hypothetical protein
MHACLVIISMLIWTNADDLLFARLNIHLDEEDKVKDVNFG